MAEETPVKLDEETRKRLAQMEVDIGQAEKAMATMRKIGMDVTPIEDKLSWAKQVRETLLSEFS